MNPAAFIGNHSTQLQIPLPPLEVQKEIVAEIEGYQKVIDGARAVLDNYRPHIPIHPDWPLALVTYADSSTTVAEPPKKRELGIPACYEEKHSEGYVDPEPRSLLRKLTMSPWMTRGIPQIGDVYARPRRLGKYADVHLSLSSFRACPAFDCA